MSYNRLFKQASTCGYFCKDNKRIYAALEILNNQNEKINFVKVKVNSGKREKTSDDNNNVVTANIVSIVVGISTYSICNHMKHIDVPKLPNIEYLEEKM